MLNYQEVFNQCIDDLCSLNIETGDVSDLIINSTATSRWGQCKKVGNSFVIQIARCLLDDDTPIDSLRNTMMHEIIHTVEGCMNHGKDFKRISKLVNDRFRYNVKRVTNYSEKGFEHDPMVSRETYHYVIKCNRCKRSWKYKRNSWSVQCCRTNEATCVCGASDFTVTNF